VSVRSVGNDAGTTSFPLPMFAEFAADARESRHRMSADQKPQDTRGDRRGAILRRADQAGVATLVLLALVAMAGYWFTHGGWRGELIEIEHAAPRKAHFQVDMNQANWPEFAQLPGVGETLARRIVAARIRRGTFRHLRQLLEVPGIGPNTLQDIRPYLLPLPADLPGGPAGEKDGWRMAKDGWRTADDGRRDLVP